MSCHMERFLSLEADPGLCLKRAHCHYSAQTPLSCSFLEDQPGSQDMLCISSPKWSAPPPNHLLSVKVALALPAFASVVMLVTWGKRWYVADLFKRWSTTPNPSYKYRSLKIKPDNDVRAKYLACVSEPVFIFHCAPASFTLGPCPDIHGPVHMFMSVFQSCLSFETLVWMTRFLRCHHSL